MNETETRASAYTCEKHGPYGPARFCCACTREVPVEEHPDVVDAVEGGRRWWEPYCKTDATDAEKIVGLTNACAYWHAVAEREPKRRNVYADALDDARRTR